MHSIIFVAKVPGLASRHDWQAFLGSIFQKGVGENNETARLSENVWLVNFQKSPRDFAWLTTCAETHLIAYGILPFDDEPRWLPVGFDPKTILARNADL